MEIYHVLKMYCQTNSFLLKLAARKQLTHQVGVHFSGHIDKINTRLSLLMQVSSYSVVSCDIRSRRERISEALRSPS